MKYDSKIIHPQAFERADHARYVKAAGREGLTAWIQKLCARACKADARKINNRNNKGE